MMDIIRQWLIGITCAAMVLALAEGLTPEGGVKKVVRLVGGVVVLLAAVSPVLRLDADEMSRIFADYQDAAGNYSRALEEKNDLLYETIIGENTAAYILDKAEGLGVSCRAEVTVKQDQSGTPYPDEVLIQGTWTEEQREQLSQSIETELGIPSQRQRFERTQE